MGDISRHDGAQILVEKLVALLEESDPAAFIQGPCPDGDGIERYTIDGNFDLNAICLALISEAEKIVQQR